MVGTSLHFVPSRPRRVIDYRTGKAIARGLGRSFTKSFTLCHRPFLIEYRCTIFWGIQLGARTSTWIDANDRSRLATPHHRPLPANRRCARSRSKLCFSPSRTAAFDQTWPMPEREAFGERASRFACNKSVRAINTSRPGREGSEAERSPDHRSCDSPLPRQFSLVTFFFARKRK